MRSILGRVMAFVSPASSRASSGRKASPSGSPSRRPAVFAAALTLVTALVLGSCEEYPTDVAVIEPLTLTGVEVTPESANVTNDAVEVSISVGARGSGGIDSAVVHLADPSGGAGGSCVAHEPVEGDRVEGAWSCEVLLSAGSLPGLWSVSRVELHHDGVEVLQFGAEELTEAGYRIAVQVLVDLTPLVGIDLPVDGSSFAPGDTVHFKGWAFSRVADGGGSVVVSDSGDAEDTGAALADSALVWTSSIDGQIGIGEEFATASLAEGEHLITLTATDASGLSASDSVRVTIGAVGPVVSKVELSPGSAFLESVGDTVRLQAVARTAEGEVVNDAVFTWASADTLVAVVDASGLVTARGLGVTQILAQTGGVGATTLVSVGGPVVEITAPADGTEFTWGDVVDLQGSAKTRTGEPIADSLLVWESSRDGELGRGPGFSTEGLSIGTHTITLSATDERGFTGVDSIRLTVEDVPEPKLLYTLIHPDTFDIAWIGGGGPENPDGIVIAVVPDPAAPAPDSITATLTGPTGQSFTCDEIGRGDPSDLVPLLPDIPMDSEPWGCIFRFGLQDVGGPVVASHWGSPTAALDAIELGTWRVTEIGMRHGGIWHTFDEAALGAAGHELSVEVIREEPGAGPEIAFIWVEPWHYESDAIGETVQFEAFAYGEYEDPVPGVTFTWSSSNPSVATVDQNGLVTTHGVGEAVITARPVGGPNDVWGEGLIVVKLPVVWRYMNAGTGTTCAVNDEDGVSYCWGYNHWDYRKLGDGQTVAISTAWAKRVAGNHRFESFAIGDYHVVALTAEGKLYAWGWNEHGQLGDGTNEPRQTPIPVAHHLTFKAIEAYGSYTIALSTDGVVYTWGRNNYGQLGDGTTEDRNYPAPIASSMRFSQISAGYWHVLALAEDGTVYGWGFNGSGQLGTGAGTATQLTPVLAAGGQTYTRVSAGSFHSLGLTSSGQVHAWGFNSAGQLGDGTNVTRHEPVVIGGLPSIVSITAGGESSFVIDAAGVGYSWGENNNGQLGDGTKVSRNTPGPIAGGLEFRAIRYGGNTIMGLTVDGYIYGWGLNASGTIGNHNYNESLVPTRAADPVD